MSWVITGSEKTPVDPQFGSVSLLLHGNGTNGSTTITDSSRFANTVTAVGNAQISTAQSKFGGASIAFDGTSDCVTTPSATWMDVGTIDFTLEAWVYQQSPTTGSKTIIARANTGSNYPTFELTVTSGTPIFYSSSTGSSYNVSLGSSVSLSANTWTHIAVTRQGSLFTIWVNGVSRGTATNSLALVANGNSLAVGAYANGTSSWLGFLDEVRVTLGVARYTANFTPPTAPFPDI